MSGIIKSVNGGTDWSFANKYINASSTALSLTSLDTADISGIAFSQTSLEKLYAGSYNLGLFVSDDSGASWKNILSKISVYDFAENYTDARTLYAVGSVGGRGKALVSTDGGAAWQEMYSEATSQDYVRSIAQNPSNPYELFIGMASGNIYVSLDGGTSWQKAQKIGSRIEKIRFEAGSLYVLA